MSDVGGAENQSFLYLSFIAVILFYIRYYPEDFVAIMVKSCPSLLALLASTILTVVDAHGEPQNAAQVAHEIAKRDAHAAHIARGLAKCEADPSYRALKQRAATRRYNKAQALREKRGLDGNSE